MFIVFNESGTPFQGENVKNDTFYPLTNYVKIGHSSIVSYRKYNGWIMARQFDLIKTDFKEEEKRIFPRFPFSYLTFKGKGDHVFEVKDISFSGMQLLLKEGEVDYQENDQVAGELHWKQASITVLGQIQWVRGKRVGVKFDTRGDFSSSIRDFLSLKNIMKCMRPLHLSREDFDLPASLKYWFRSEGPVELFVWSHQDGELSRYQVIYFKNFIEWEDGIGLKTGEVMTKRDLDTPLFAEDEFIFQIDNEVDRSKLTCARELIESLPEDLLNEGVRNFLIRKIGVKNG